MKLGQLRSLGHNIADSVASGVGLMIGLYQSNVFAEAASDEYGFLVVDFLEGSVAGSATSESFRMAVKLYAQQLPDLCFKHGVDPATLTRLQARFGTDAVYGPHYTVSVADTLGRKSTDRYLGVPGRRMSSRRAPGASASHQDGDA